MCHRYEVNAGQLTAQDQARRQRNLTSRHSGERGKR